MKEYSKYKTIIRSYIIDDGWCVPREVIEIVELGVKRAWKEAMADVRKKKAMHKGGWITKDIADAYFQKAWPYRMVNGNQYTGFVRELGKDLQERYGVTELEAINILNGMHVREYIHKYNQIRNLIPTDFCSQDICDSVLAELGYCVSH